MKTSILPSVVGALALCALVATAAVAMMRLPAAIAPLRLFLVAVCTVCTSLMVALYGVLKLIYLSLASTAALGTIRGAESPRTRATHPAAGADSTVDPTSAPPKPPRPGNFATTAGPRPNPTAVNTRLTYGAPGELDGAYTSPALTTHFGCTFHLVDMAVTPIAACYFCQRPAMLVCRDHCVNCCLSCAALHGVKAVS